jgi:hypothetical protein
MSIFKETKVKKLVIIAVIMITDLISMSFGANYNIPNDYRLVKSVNYGAVSVYKKGGIYVSVINLDKAKVNVGNVEESGSNLFVKNSMNTWWSDYKNNKTLAMYNGQFFSMNGYLSSDTTTLSFPLRSYWRSINTSTDSGSLRTLYVDSRGKTKIFPNYTSSYLNYSKELIVGLNPSTNKGYNNSTGRFYIVGIPRKDGEPYYSRDMKYLLLFTAVSSTQTNMMYQISRWNGYKANTIMMDGSGSAQMRVGSLKVYGNGFPQYRHLPNVISIEKK